MPFLDSSAQKTWGYEISNNYLKNYRFYKILSEIKVGPYKNEHFRGKKIQIFLKMA